MDRKDLKVGMKVRLKSKEIEYCFGGFNDEMEQALGTVVTIVELADKYFEFKEEHGRWCWDYRYIEEVIDKKEVTIARPNENEDIDRCVRSANSDIRLEIIKTIVNGNCVVMIVKNNDGKIFKAVSKCQAEDTFNLETGIRICILKIRKKTAEYDLKQLMK